MSSDDRRGRYIARLQPTFSRRADHLGDGGGPIPRRSHDPVLAQPLATDLELGFHQQNEVGRRAAQVRKVWHYQGQGDKAHVGDEHLDRPTDLVRRQSAHRNARSFHHPRIAAEGRSELAVPDIDGDDLARSPRQ